MSTVSLRFDPIAVVRVLLAETAAFSSLPPDIPSPPSILGFEPGTQRQLASYDESESYFRKLDAASDRMNLYEDRTPPTARHEVLELLFEVGDVQSLHETVADKVDVLRGPRSTSTDAASSPSGTPTATGRC